MRQSSITTESSLKKYIHFFRIAALDQLIHRSCICPVHITILASRPTHSAFDACERYLVAVQDDSSELSNLISKYANHSSKDLQPALQLYYNLWSAAELTITSSEYIKAREKKEQEDKEYRQTRNRVILGTLGAAAVIGLGALGYHRCYASELAAERQLRASAEEHLENLRVSSGFREHSTKEFTSRLLASTLTLLEQERQEHAQTRQHLEDLSFNNGRLHGALASVLSSPLPNYGASLNR